MVGTMKAKKSLGQNFLIDENIINKIAGKIPAFANDLIVEIGPGRGALTEKLVKKDTFYLAFEIDKDLTKILQKYESKKAQIIYEDILKVDLNNYLKDLTYNNLFIVGNLPYYITTPIIEKIIQSNLKITKLVIMVQKEVAERFMAQPQSKDYGYFTLYLKYFFDIKKVCDVSKNSFWPVPKIESMVISFEPRENQPNVDILKYQEFLKECFTQKRKTLKNNLKSYNWSKIKEILKQNNYSENVRAEELSEDMFLKIFKDVC